MKPTLKDGQKIKRGLESVDKKVQRHKNHCKSKDRSKTRIKILTIHTTKKKLIKESQRKMNENKKRFSILMTRK